MDQKMQPHALIVGGTGAAAVGKIVMFAYAAAVALLTAIVSRAKPDMPVLDNETAAAIGALLICWIVWRSQKKGEPIPPFLNGGGAGGEPSSADPAAAKR